MFSAHRDGPSGCSDEMDPGRPRLGVVCKAKAVACEVAAKGKMAAHMVRSVLEESDERLSFSEVHKLPDGEEVYAFRVYPPRDLTHEHIRDLLRRVDWIEPTFENFESNIAATVDRAMPAANLPGRAYVHCLVDGKSCRIMVFRRDAAEQVSTALREVHVDVTKPEESPTQNGFYSFRADPPSGQSPARIRDLLTQVAWIKVCEGS